MQGTAHRANGLRPGGTAACNPFATRHPAVAFAFLACAIAFSMGVLEPVYIACSAMGALACLAVTRGPVRAAQSLAWAIPVQLATAAANALLSSEGSTVLFVLGGRPVHLEALAYGLASGGMLAAVLLWFSSYAACLESDGSLALFGNLAPTVALMATQVMRLVPQFVARGRAVFAVQRAASAARPRSKAEAASDRLRVVSVLVGWGMEDALVRGDAMRARGYESGMRRTTYRRQRLGRADALLIALVAALALVNAPLALAAAGDFSFYPAVGAPQAWWHYVPYAALMAVPIVLAAREWWLWRS